MQDNIEKKILAAVIHPRYRPLKPAALARKIGLEKRYDDYKVVLKRLIKAGQVVLGEGQTIRPRDAGIPKNAVTGTFRKTAKGIGFVRPANAKGKAEEIYIEPNGSRDASTGDTVLVRIDRQTPRGPRGIILKVLERGTQNFVGAYFERDGDGYVRVDGTVFAHSVYVGDPGAKGVKPDDKVVIEMVRFPSPDDRGEAVITEILGARGQPGVDTLSILRAYGLPDEFPPDVLEEARLVAAEFDERNLEGRDDLTKWLTITIDPVDARDFDDAISLSVDPRSKHWLLGVHIADVTRFARVGGHLDHEAKKRATSVYLPQRVVPMFPELISNGLASLQQDHVRFVKSAIVDFTPAGQRTHVRFANAAIQVRRRFTYEQVRDIFAAADEGKTAEQLAVPEEIFDLLLRMRELGLILRARRVKRGSLQLQMPEIALDYDASGKVVGAHVAENDLSHQVIEEFMLTANESVAEALDDRKIAFLRRVHPAPEPAKLHAFAEFARHLGYKIKNETDRFTLQKVLNDSAQRPEVHAVHYAMLRSLKQATYSPEKEQHFALASENYCHFTSPIRRYPDLIVHRLLDHVLKTGSAKSDFNELVVLGQHCSKMERRAEVAERELVKHKLLVYMSERIGSEMDAIITGVAEYGFYAQATEVPVEGLVHISTLPGDYYHFDEPSHSLVGQRHGRRFRLGDKVRIKAIRVDLGKRQMDFRLVTETAPVTPPIVEEHGKPAKPAPKPRRPKAAKAKPKPAKKPAAKKRPRKRDA
ncbi:MAG TPA: ribonuclease R [Gemmataceae bacterium]|jgi:ribonuclease R|nr:ribonuclease R [Gemmataceae bacterium]